MIEKKNLKNTSFYYILGGALIGAILFLVMYGVSPVNPTNVQYLYALDDEDVPSHQLGFDFFRNQPWTMPAGENDLYPYRYTSSVFFSNSLPLFAIIFKLFNPILPEFFQYFGLWSILCFMLQGIFAALILYKLEVKIWPALLSVPLFICNVPLLFRTFHHMEFTGQWIILAAFYIALCQKEYSTIKKTALWGILIFVSILVHAYMFFIVGFIMTISLIRDSVIDQKYIKNGLVFITAVLAFFVGFYIEGGFIPVAYVRKIGFGGLSFSITDLFDPAHSSALFTALDSSYENEEQAAYLGGGIILLLVICFIMLLIKRKNIKIQMDPENKTDVLLVALGAGFLFLLSLSPRIRYMHYTVFDLTPLIPKTLLRALSVFRASARFFIPVWYLILIIAIFALQKLCLDQKKIIALLAVCVVFQWIDIVPANARRIDQSISIEYSDVLYNTFDDVFNEEAKHVAFMGQFFQHMIEPAVFAAHHDMSYNASNVARGHKTSIAEDICDWNSGNLQRDTVYIIPLRTAYCVDPIELPQGFVVYMCNEYFVVFDESISKAAPLESAALIDEESMQGVIAYLNTEYANIELVLSPDEY